MKNAVKINKNSPQVHFLFEGLLSGQLRQLTPDQTEILVYAMSRAFPALKRREKVARRGEKQAKPGTQNPRGNKEASPRMWMSLLERLAWGAVAGLSLWLVWTLV